MNIGVIKTNLRLQFSSFYSLPMRSSLQQRRLPFSGDLPCRSTRSSKNSNPLTNVIRFMRENQSGIWRQLFMSLSGIRSRRRPISPNMEWPLNKLQPSSWTPLAVTIPDNEHSGSEDRWITLGKDDRGHYVLVVHTFEWSTADRGRVRLISARKPTRAEIRVYEGQT